METFNFDELKRGIYYKLIYPKNILATRLEAMEILGLSSYYFKKLRKLRGFSELLASGYTFFYKEDLYDYKREMKEPVPHTKSSDHIDYENLSKEIRIKLIYPEDNLLTRKTGPTFLFMNKRTFDQLRYDGEFTVYEHLGVKFFNKEEIRVWKEKRRLQFLIKSKPDYYTKKRIK